MKALKATLAGLTCALLYLTYQYPLGFVAVFVPVILISDTVGMARRRGLELVLGVLTGVLFALMILQVLSWMPLLSLFLVLLFIFTSCLIMKNSELLIPATIAAVIPILLVDIATTAPAISLQLAIFMPFNFILSVVVYSLFDGLIKPQYAYKESIKQEMRFKRLLNQAVTAPDTLSVKCIENMEECYALIKKNQAYLLFEACPELKEKYSRQLACMRKTIATLKLFGRAPKEEMLSDLIASLKSASQYMEQQGTESLSSPPLKALLEPQSINELKQVKNDSSFNEAMASLSQDFKSKTGPETSLYSSVKPDSHQSTVADRVQINFAFRAILAVTLAFLLQSYAGWTEGVVAVATALVVSAKTTGKMIQSLFWRIGGVLSGVIAGAAFIVFLSYLPSPFFLFLFVALTLYSCGLMCSWGPKYNYMAIQMAVVIVIMLLSSPYYSGDLTGGVLIRGGGIIAGCIIALIVGLLFPSHAYSQMMQSIKRNRQRISQLTQFLNQQDWEKAIKTAFMTEKSIADIRPMIDEMQYEFLFIKKTDIDRIQPLLSAFDRIESDLHQLPVLGAYELNRLAGKR